MKALIIVADGTQDVEWVYPRYRLDEAGYEVHTAEPRETYEGGALAPIGECRGIKGLPITTTHGIFDVLLTDYDVLILTGGAKAIEKLRQNGYLLEMIRNFKGVIGSMCSAAHLLISAKVVKGRRISGYYALKDDIENAGATFVDAPFVTDGNITSSPHYRYLGPWMAEVLRVATERRNNPLGNSPDHDPDYPHA